MSEEQRKSERNQGEGNREAARRYNEDQQEFVEEGQVEKAAEEAVDALESHKERSKLEKAEEKGESHAKEFDPNVKRDY